jgi:acetate kinase
VRAVRVLVVNAGSSSLKLSLVASDDGKVAARELPAPGARAEASAVAEALSGTLGEAADAVGHRVVHGGERYRAAVVIDAEVERALRELADLAPLHQEKSPQALDAVSATLPDTPAVACFDTAFHATLPAAASTYALPASWRERWPVRRFGFHGLSHAWVARRAPQVLGIRRRAGCASSAAISAQARRCARSPTGARLTQRWGSRRSRVS